MVTLSEVTWQSGPARLLCFLQLTSIAASHGLAEQQHPELILPCSHVSNLLQMSWVAQSCALLTLHGPWPIHGLAVFLKSFFATFLKIFVVMAVGPKPSSLFQHAWNFPRSAGWTQTTSFLVKFLYPAITTCCNQFGQQQQPSEALIKHHLSLLKPTLSFTTLLGTTFLMPSTPHWSLFFSLSQLNTLGRWAAFRNHHTIRLQQLCFSQLCG